MAAPSVQGLCHNTTNGIRASITHSERNLFRYLRQSKQRPKRVEQSWLVGHENKELSQFLKQNGRQEHQQHGHWQRARRQSRVGTFLTGLPESRPSHHVITRICLAVPLLAGGARGPGFCRPAALAAACASSSSFFFLPSFPRVTQRLELSNIQPPLNREPLLAFTHDQKPRGSLTYLDSFLGSQLNCQRNSSPSLLQQFRRNQQPSYQTLLTF